MRNFMVTACLTLWLGACQTTGLPDISALPARELPVSRLSVDRYLIRMTSGYEMLILFERFSDQGKLAFCTWGVSRENPGNLPRLWLDHATIYFGDQPVASGAMIPIHLRDDDGRYIARCAKTNLDFDRNSLTGASVKGGSVRGEI